MSAEAHVELHALDLDAPPAPLPLLWETLSHDERTRADAFHFPRDRDRYVVGRGWLRRLLAARLGLAPQALPLAHGPQGKPFVPGTPVHFNLTHSGARALVALSVDTELGVDLEETAPQPDRLALADRFFAPREAARLRRMPPEAQDAAFLACWTRKEAFLKAEGVGLSRPLEDFEVGFGPGVPCALLWTSWAPEEAERWQLADVSDPLGAYVATVAARCDVLCLDELIKNHATGTPVPTRR